LGFFADHLALVDRFLDRRPAIVERIEHALLNVRDKDTSRRRDRPFFEQTFNACFFGLPDLPPELARLKGQLAARHLADGFEPVASENTFVNELDPLELILRAYEQWERSRWPGRSGRLSYAGTLYAVFLLRLLESLSLRIWDDGSATARDRLDHLQRRLDRLNEPGSPVFLRDAAWLVQTSQGPLTKHLRPYLDVAARIAGSLKGPRGVAVHSAGARLAGGHLRSQRRYRAWMTGRPADDLENLAFTRTSNALDGALVVGDLVPLLEAYRAACVAHDEDGRVDLADAILQGVSADPELYVTRLDLLAPYVTIEDLFIEHSDGRWRRTPMGEHHRETRFRYEQLIGELAPSLIEDAQAVDPAGRAYSPQGITYGFIADVMSNMAQDVLMGQSSFGLSLEDMFVSRGSLDAKLARAGQWAALPVRKSENQHFDCSAAWAVENYARLTAALAARASHPDRPNASDCRTTRIFVGQKSVGSVRVDEYCVTSDPSRVRPDGPAFCREPQILDDRSEGRYLASVRAGSGWFGISKAILTMFTSTGTDVGIDDVPDAIDVLQLTCPALVATSSSKDTPPA
jgi:hypothetical protein